MWAAEGPPEHHFQVSTENSHESFLYFIQKISYEPIKSKYFITKQMQSGVCLCGFVTMSDPFHVNVKQKCNVKNHLRLEAKSNLTLA